MKKKEKKTMTKQEEIKPIQMTVGPVAFPYSADGLLKDEEIRKYVCIRFNREPTKEELEYMVILTEKQYAARIKGRDERIIKELQGSLKRMRESDSRIVADNVPVGEVLYNGFENAVNDLEQIMKGEER